MALNWPAKDPDEVLDYVWEPDLDTGDTIDSHTITVAGGTASIQSHDADTAKLNAFISGGTAGETTSFLARVVTSAGRTIEETIYLPIKATDNALISTFRIRYPSFATVADDVISFWLTDAERSVDATWIAADIDPAKMALAAHNMTVQGIGKGAVPVGVTKFKSASFEANISDSIAGAKGYASTKYGREFQIMLRRNHAGPRLVQSA